MRKVTNSRVTVCCSLLVCSFLYTGWVYREGWLGLGQLDGDVTVFDPASVQVMWARKQCFQFIIFCVNYQISRDKCQVTPFDCVSTPSLLGGN